MELFVYLIEREDSSSVRLIALQDWQSVVDCLTKLDGIDERVTIHRMPVCKSD